MFLVHQNLNTDLVIYRLITVLNAPVMMPALCERQAVVDI